MPLSVVQDEAKNLNLGCHVKGGAMVAIIVTIFIICTIPYESKIFETLSPYTVYEQTQQGVSQYCLSRSLWLTSYIRPMTR